MTPPKAFLWRDEIVNDVTEYDKVARIVAIGIFLEEIDGLAFPVHDHHAAFITTIDLFHRAILILKGAEGGLKCHELFGQSEFEL